MDGSLARALARLFFESVQVPVLPPPVLRVKVLYGLVSQLPSSDDAVVFLPLSVFTRQHHAVNIHSTPSITYYSVSQKKFPPLNFL